MESVAGLGSQRPAPSLLRPSLGLSFPACAGREEMGEACPASLLAQVFYVLISPSREAPLVPPRSRLRLHDRDPGGHVREI